MAKRSLKYRTDRDKILDQMEALLASAETTGGELSAAQQTEFDGLKAKAAALKVSIDREEELEREERAAPAVTRTPAGAPGTRVQVRDRAEHDPARGFHGSSEFLMSVLENRGKSERADVEERLRPLCILPGKGDEGGGADMAFALPAAFTPRGLLAAAGSDEQGGYSDRFGGFAVPVSVAPGVLTVGFEGDPTAGRTQPVPMTTPQVDIVARTDKDHSTSVSGGFTVTRKPETVLGAGARAQIEKVSLKASSLFGFAFATEEILTDSPISFVAMISAGFKDQFQHQVLSEKIRGGGGTEYIGALSSPALVSIAKDQGQQAATISYKNVINMRARCWGYGDAIWLANHDTFPQLSTLSIPIGVAGQLIYQLSLVDDRPDRMLGRPIFYTEYASTVGAQGDLLLVNWSQFLEGMYQPLQSAESVHVRFLNHERAFKFWVRNAGAPWWRSALTPNKGANTLSPLVTLDPR